MWRITFPFDSDLSTCGEEEEWWHAASAAMTNDNGKSKTTATSNCPGINGDLLTLKRIGQIWQPWTRRAARRAWPQPCVFLLVVQRCFPLCCHEIYWEHLQSWRDEDRESSVVCDPSVSCNSCLWHQSMRLPLSHITSLPLKTNGSAIQFHTSALRGWHCWRRSGDLCLNKDKKLFEVAKGVVDRRGKRRDGQTN